MRYIIFLLIGALALAILRNVVREVGRFVSRAMAPKTPTGTSEGASGHGRMRTGRRLVQDPHSGTYVDPDHAVRAKVGDTVHYFESEASRDAYVKSQT